jgi:adenosylcobinamide kinase/adenosylcobinamide-phosphate guanylyltransferase
MSGSRNTSCNSATLILGGCRSGKSRFAEQRARRFQRRLFIATMQAGDDAELHERIRRHRQSRGDGWETVEEPLHLVETIERRTVDAEVILVDCLTLWLSNCLLVNQSDEEIRLQLDQLGQTVLNLEVPLLLVANEVGLGLVPESPLGRRFRDLAGWCNQQLAECCQEVIFMAAGLPLRLK